MKMMYKIGSIFISVVTLAHASNMSTRAPRTDVFPFAGTQQIVVAESAQLAQIKQCVCNLTTLLNECCSSLDMQISGLASTLENDLESIIDILSGISNLDVFISGFELLFSLVEAINVSLIETLVQEIQGLDSSFDHVSELIDSDIVTDQETLSKVSKIEMQTDTIISLLDILVNQNCASDNDALLTTVDYINSNIDTAIATATEILNIDQTVVSKIAKIETQLDTITSLIDFAVIDCSSRSDIMIEQVQSLQDQEAQCCTQLFSSIDAVQQDIDSRLEVIEDSANAIQISISQLALLESIIDNFDDALIASLIDTTESGFDVITTQLDSLAACSSTPITSATTITVPGNYCLAQDITGNITIASSNVTLDLNGHTLAGSVIINTGLSSIIVTNGFIAPTGAATAGIRIFEGCDTISLTALSIDGPSSFAGIQAVGTLADPIINLYISDVSVQNSAQYGIFLSQCPSAIIVNSAVNTSASVGFYVTNFTLPITIKNCVAGNNGGVGFYLLEGGPLYIEGCTSYSNITGFTVDTIAGISMSHCFAFENVTAGYSAVNGSNGLISGCVAMENGSQGFNVPDYPVTTVRYTANYATDNGPGSTIINYATSGVAVAKNNAPYYWLSWKNSGAGHWINIDGNDLS